MKLHPYNVSHRLPREEEDQAFLARAFGDEWGHPVTAWRLVTRGDVATYDLLWPHSLGELEKALREASATEIEIETYDVLPPEAGA
jgi:hypothetical protein